MIHVPSMQAKGIETIDKQTQQTKLFFWYVFADNNFIYNLSAIYQVST